MRLPCTWLNDMDDAYLEVTTPQEVQRFRLGELIGEGADLQVFAGSDLNTGEPVVIKRPHPSLVSRNMHDDVQRRAALQARLRIEYRELEGLPELYAVTSADRFDWYFGDDPGLPYSVQIEERAKGIPLLGSIGDQVRGRPVGLPLNLFVLHPSLRHWERDIRSPSLMVLDIIERCESYGLLIGDLGPRNVFFSPGSGAAMAVDLGALRRPQQETRRTRRFDLNDTLFEFFVFYTTPVAKPTTIGGFSSVSEQRHSGPLERMAQAGVQAYAAAASGQREAAETILASIAARGYSSVAEFRQNFEEYLSELKTKPQEPGAERVWRSALDGLRDAYWNRYLYDADLELATYA